MLQNKLDFQSLRMRFMLRKDCDEVKKSESNLGKLKFILTILTIVMTSYQTSDLTTNTLNHSRNFIRFLNYYLIGHTGFDIYWAGQYMINYPINQYFQISEVVQFLQNFQDTMETLDQKVYGMVDFDSFLSGSNVIRMQLKKETTLQFQYIIKEGFVKPFQINNLQSIKDSILCSEQLQIVLKPFSINNHQWSIMISITTYSQSSIFVRIYAKQSIQLWQDHLATFTLGIMFFLLLFYEYYQSLHNLKISQLIIQNIPEYFICVFLINTFVFSVSEEVDVQWLVILDGIQCLIAWLLILKFFQKDDDYHISFLIRKSYVLVARLFVSFGPIFIAFTLFAYAIFCRQAWQFSTYKRTFLNLFYICYYNMTYESFVVTSRANPISMIFFFVFVILFTICVYSGMLVSVFCSYVWNKRESKIKNDIINNLKIQCSECDTKYRYIDCLQNMKKTKKSMRVSFVLQTNFSSADSRYKYKKTLHRKINQLAQMIYEILQDNKKQIAQQNSIFIQFYAKNHVFEKHKQSIYRFLLQFQSEHDLNQKYQKQKNS